MKMLMSAVEPRWPRRKHLGRIPVKLPMDKWVVYFITCANYQRRVVWDNAAAVELAVDVLREVRQRLQWRVPLYCCMPDHVHIVAYPQLRGQCLSSFMQQWRSITTKRLHAGGVHGRIWQPEFFDRLLRSSEDLHQKCAYVRNNPVRAGLATDWEEYPYTGSLDAFPV